jgi:RNA polymerase primary sigma factor
MMVLNDWTYDESEESERGEGKSDPEEERFWRGYRRRVRLTPQQELELGRRAAAGDEAAVQILVEANFGLVVKWARRYAEAADHVLPLDDLVQEGCLGLLKAARRFDYRRGLRFSTYAVNWIRQAILRCLAQQSRLIRLPVHIDDMIRRMQKTVQRLARQYGREPTPAELAEALGLSVEDTERLLTLARPSTSLDAPLRQDSEDTFLDLQTDELAVDPEQAVLHEELRQGVETLLAALTDREQQILRWRFGLDDNQAHTLQEIAEKVGLSRERVRQIEKQALEKLRAEPSLDKLLRLTGRAPSSSDTYTTAVATA